MAKIIQRLELDSGVVIENVYCRVDTVSGSKLGVVADLKHYISKEASKTKAYVYCEQINFVPDVSDGAPEWIEQAYLQMNNIEKFFGAIDA